LDDIDFSYDRQLVEGAREGDRQAARELIERHQQRVHRLAYRLTGDLEAAGDIAQETFLRLLNNLEHINDPQALSGWLTRTSTNLARDRWRSQRDTVEFDETFHQDGSDRGSPGDRVASAQMSEHIQRALMELPHRYREAFILRHVEELTHEQMCAELAIGLSAVKVRIHRACLMLRELLPEYGGE
jgi:RNA polymerase sigma-70 factor, ECF subfamily